jgi:mono/diheme cytochrome c family protein/cytochrome c553
MITHLRILALASALGLLSGLAGTGTSADAVDDLEGERLYRETIEPVLRANCFGCHSATAEKLKGGLVVDTRNGLLRGGDGGPAVVPGKSGESLLIQAIRHEGGLEMPPKKPKLSDPIIADFAKWVDLGAPGPREGTVAAPPSVASPEARRHWAFQPVQAIGPPTVRDPQWVRNPIDAFVLAKLEERRWIPARQVERTEWIRRVSFDLTGLPPSPEDIEAFVNDLSPNAFENVADRLLESPRYGERWAQHWFDVVRFAESEGFEYDRHLPDAWRYRDYVIDSLNHDKPFDRFVIEQVAGDEIAPQDPECQAASTFHRLGPVRRNAGNPEIALSRNDVLAERTDIIGSAFLGLTVGCARCHDHKLEPIAQKDYYRLEAYLAATEEHNIVLASAEDQKVYEDKIKSHKKQLKKLQEQARKAVGAEKSRLKTQAEDLEDQEPPSLPTIPSTWNDHAHRTAIHVLKRGVWENKGEPVGPRPLSVLVTDDLPELPADTAYPRTQLAHWLADPKHPLTARVIVNRLWQHHFGAGLVRTANDFGTKGDRPSHPELLDWLAAKLVDEEWRLKPIHRLIVLSATYRQSSQRDNPRFEEDPDNRLLWHFSRRRLGAEEIRDAMLAASGRLNPKAGGASAMVAVEPELVALLYKPAQWRVTKDRSEHDRRTIYLVAKRNLRMPFLESFDAPTTMTSCPARESSTHAPQALELLNGTLSNDLATAFAARLERECNGDPDRMIERGYRLAVGRSPSAREQELSRAFLHGQPVKEFALALFNLNGFLYVP